MVLENVKNRKENLGRVYINIITTGEINIK